MKSKNKNHKPKTQNQMTTSKMLKTPVPIYFNEDDFNRTINRAQGVVNIVNNLLQTAKQNGFNFNDDEATRFIERDYHEALKDCLKRTEKIKYEVNPDSFKKQLVTMSNARMYLILNIPGCFLIKDQKAVVSEDWKESERSFRTILVTTDNGLKKYQLIKEMAEEVNNKLDQLNGDLIFSDIFRIDENGRTVAFPLQYDEL